MSLKDVEKKQKNPRAEPLTAEEVQALTDAKDTDTEAERFLSLLKKATRTPAPKYRQKDGES